MSKYRLLMDASLFSPPSSVTSSFFAATASLRCSGDDIFGCSSVAPVIPGNKSKTTPPLWVYFKPSPNIKWAHFGPCTKSRTPLLSLEKMSIKNIKTFRESALRSFTPPVFLLLARRCEEESGDREMSKKLLQPIGQKRLTNVAVVRLKKHGNRFEIACYPNKVLSWRSGVEKDLDEVLQSQTVYSNVSKGVLAKSKELIAAFGTDDQSKICLEILNKGELQVAGKERESQLSSQFRDIATIVMQKTINPETQRPYTISMIERLMHEIHFAVDPHSSSKKQALEVIRELQKQFPIKRAPMRIRLTVPENTSSSLVEKLNAWEATITARDSSGSQLSFVCEIEPGFFRDCDILVRNLQGRMEILAVSVHFEGDTHVDDIADHVDLQPSLPTKGSADTIAQLSEKIQKQTISSAAPKKVEAKQNQCSTCSAVVGDAKEYREHFKSDWHKHNLKRKTRNLPPLTADECSADVNLGDSKSDLKDYSF